RLEPARPLQLDVRPLELGVAPQELQMRALGEPRPENGEREREAEADPVLRQRRLMGDSCEKRAEVRDDGGAGERELTPQAPGKSDHASESEKDERQRQDLELAAYGDVIDPGEQGDPDDGE